MKFRVEHLFNNISVNDYEQLFFDEDFNIKMCEAVKLARTLVSLERTDKAINRAVTVGPDREIPGPVAKILGANRIEYTEHIDYDFGSGKAHWKTISSLLTDKVKSSGRYLFQESGSGVRRIVEGEIKVKIFGVGGVVERFIIADIERSYNKVADFTQRWIEEQG